MTWNDLKEFANSLDEKQLEKRVVMWSEDEAFRDIEPSILEDDHYIGEGDPGCYPLSDAGLTIEDVGPKGLRKVYEKGTPILWNDIPLAPVNDPETKECGRDCIKDSNSGRCLNHG